MKTMCKRTLAFLLCALLLCGALPFAASASEVLSGNCGKYGDNVTWTLDTETGLLTISGTGEMADYEFEMNEAPEPWEAYRDQIKTVSIGLGVTRIGKQSFYCCENLRIVTIADSVKEIGEYAFAITDLESVSIPDQVTVIEDGTFEDCTNLKSVSIPGVTKIGFSAFFSCSSLTAVKLSVGVTKIGASAFSYCTNLQNFTIPNSVITIESNAFFGCTELKTTNIPDSVTYIGENVFFDTQYYDDYYNTPKNWTGDALYIGKHLMAVRENAQGVYTILPGTVCIAGEAFAGCGDLTGVMIPNSVKGIGDEAFKGCRSISQLTIPHGVTRIGYAAFYGCKGLTSIILPDSVTQLGASLCLLCTNLVFLHIPASVTEIEIAYEYGECPAYICSDTANCAAKTYAEELGFEFRVCEGHDEPEILSGNCGKYGDNVTWTLNTGTGTLTISGTGAMEDYIYDSDLTPPWETYSGQIKAVVVETGVTHIGRCAFMNCDTLVSATVGEDVIDISWYAFAGCKALTNVTIGNSVTYLSDGAFSGCSNLVHISIPDSVTSIGSSAFFGCASLNHFTIPNRTTYIGEDAFGGCASLTSVMIPDSVTTIWTAAFESCTSLTDVTIGKGVTTLKNGVFSDCLNLKTITVSENNSAYCSEYGVLYNKDKTELIQYPVGNARASFTIPNGIRYISSKAFLGCKSLSSLIIPDSVSSIGDYAFYNCSGLLSVVIPQTVSRIEYVSFFGCTNLVYVHIPANVKNIVGNNMFDGCLNLAYICSDTADCYAKTYAETNGIPFRVCDGTHSEPADTPVFHGEAGGVKAECPDGTFDEETYLRVTQDGSAKDPLAEFGISIKGFAMVQQLYYIHVQNEHGEYVQPNAGHKVTLRLPLILDGFGNPYPLEKYGVYHIDSETGSAESFRAKNNNLRIEGGYLVFEVSRFSPFIVTVEEGVPTIKMQDTKKTLPYGEKRTLTADVENLPDGAKIVWTSDNANVNLKLSADGRSCVVSAEKNGKTTITAMVVDKDGKEVKQDGETVSVSVTLQIKANFFHKLWYWITHIPWPFGK